MSEIAVMSTVGAPTDQEGKKAEREKGDEVVT